VFTFSHCRSLSKRDDNRIVVSHAGHFSIFPDVDRFRHRRTKHGQQMPSELACDSSHATKTRYTTYQTAIGPTAALRQQRRCLTTMR